MAAQVAFLTAKFSGDERVQKLMRETPEILRDVMTQEVTDRTLALLDRVRRKASGSVIGVDTGKLLASIKPSVRIQKGAVRGKVRSSGVKYFGVINFGGTLQARDIRAKKKMLHFLTGSGEMFAGLVHHPAYKIRKHEIMYSSRDEIEDDTKQRLAAAVDIAIERAKKA